MKSSNHKIVGMSIDLKRLLKWQMRRGMKELDLILESFIEKSYENFTQNDFILLAKLASHEDQTLWNCLVLHEKIDPELNELIQKIKRNYQERFICS